MPDNPKPIFARTSRRHVFALAALAASALCAGCATNAPHDHTASAHVGQSDVAALRKLAAEKSVEVEYTAPAQTAQTVPTTPSPSPTGAEFVDRSEVPFNVDRVVKKEDKYDLHLTHLEIDCKAPLEGTLTTTAPANELKMLWVDGAQRVMGEYNVEAFKAKAGEPIAFSVNMPDRCIGQLHRLVVVRVTPRDNDAAPVIPPVVVAQSRFQVHIPQPWDEYFVVLRGGEYLSPKAWQKLRELGISGGASDSVDAPTTFTRQALPFFSELIAPDENLLKAGKTLEQTYLQYRKSRDAAVLQRGLSLFDDTAVAQMTEHIDGGLTTKRGFQALGWSLGDALSLTPSRNAPFDGSMARGTLDVFRAWLQKRYHTLAALNQEWGSNFAAWDLVHPPTTDQVLLTDKPKSTFSLVPEPVSARPVLVNEPSENFAAWSDFRAFNDFAFARLLREFKAQLQHDANSAYEVRAGVTSVAAPSPFNGWDAAQVAKVLDWAEEHDDACSRDVMRSFSPSMHWLSQVSGPKPTDVYQLWDRWLRGDCGCIADARTLVDDKQEPLPAAKTLAADFRELSSGVTQLRQTATSVHDGVAIYYSPRSLQLNWLLDCQPHGSSSSWGAQDWMDRDAASNSGLADLRAWSLLLEDLGYAPTYLNAQQLHSGVLATSHTKVLILPRVVALSDEETAAIRKFAKSGGVVVADGACGLFDGSGKRRPALGLETHCAGALDNDFGIARRDLSINDVSTDASAARVTLIDAETHKPVGPSSPELRVLEPGVVPYMGGRTAGGASTEVGAGTLTGCPAFITRASGKGHFVYLNLLLQDYTALREAPDAKLFMYFDVPRAQYEKQFGAPTGGEAVRLVLGDLLGEACAASPLKVWSDESVPIRGLRQSRFQFGDHELFGLQRRFGSATVEQTVWVGTASNRCWYDVRNGQFLGTGKSVKARLNPLRPTLLAALPYKVERLNLKLRRIDPRGSFKATATIITALDLTPGTHVFHAEITNDAGVVLPAYTQTFIAAEGQQDFQIVLGLNEPAGIYHLTVRDVETGIGGSGDLLKDETEYPQVSDAKK